MIDQMAHLIRLSAIPRRGAQCPMRPGQIDDNETTAPANEGVWQASESFPARRALLRGLGRMILHRLPPLRRSPRSRQLSVLSRNPKHIGGAIVVHCPTRHEQKVRETIDVFESAGRDVFARLVLELSDEALGASADR